MEDKIFICILGARAVLTMTSDEFVSVQSLYHRSCQLNSYLSPLFSHEHFRARHYYPHPKHNLLPLYTCQNIPIQGLYPTHEDLLNVDPSVPPRSICPLAKLNHHASPPHQPSTHTQYANKTISRMARPGETKFYVLPDIIDFHSRIKSRITTGCFSRVAEKIGRSISGSVD